MRGDLRGVAGRIAGEPGHSAMQNRSGTVRLAMRAIERQGGAVGDIHPLLRRPAGKADRPGKARALRQVQARAMRLTTHTS